MELKPFKNWWLWSAKGTLLVLLGILALIFPGKAIVVIALFLGVMILVAGIFLVVGSFLYRRYYRYWSLWFLEGLLDVVIGFILVAYPVEAAALLLFVLGTWSILLGVIQLIYAFITPWHRFFWVLCALLSIVLGILIILNPFAGAVMATYFIAIHTIALGGILFYLSLELRKLHENDDDFHYLIYRES